MKSFYCELMSRDEKGIFRPLIVSTVAANEADAGSQIKRSINASDSAELGEIKEATLSNGCTLLHIGSGTGAGVTVTGPTQELGATSTNGPGAIAVVPYVHHGNPSVLVFIKTNASAVFKSTLDGEPALAFVLGEQSPGKENGPWEFGHHLAERFEEAVKLAAKDKQAK